MELLNINALRGSSRHFKFTTYTLTDERTCYFGAYAYLNVGRAENSPANIVVAASSGGVLNADEFNLKRYGIAK